MRLGIIGAIFLPQQEQQDKACVESDYHNSCMYHDSNHPLDPLPVHPSPGSIIHELERTIASLKVEETLIQYMSPDLHNVLQWRARSAPTYAVEAELVHILDPTKASHYLIPKRRIRKPRRESNETLYVRGYMYGTFSDGTKRVADSSDLDDDTYEDEDSSRSSSMRPTPLQLDPDELSFSVHATNEARLRMLRTRNHLEQIRSVSGQRNGRPADSAASDPQLQSAVLRNLRSQELFLTRSLRSLWTESIQY